MGFGYIFVGFFFLLRMQLYGVDITPDFIGCILMYSGMKRLCGYTRENRALASARAVLLPLTGVTAVEFVLQLTTLAVELPELLLTAVRLIAMLTVGVFTTALLVGIHKLSLEVELPKLARRAVGAIAVTGVYYILSLLGSLGATEALASLAEKPGLMLSLISAATLALSLVWFFSVWLTIGSCYMRICLEGDEDMPYRDNLYDRTLRSLTDKKKGKHK